MYLKEISLKNSYKNHDFSERIVCCSRVSVAISVENDVYFFSSKMKVLNYFIFIFSSTLFLSGCELLCQAGTGTCGMSREEMQKALHPKAYGEYFVKPGLSRDEWWRDWVACGGMADGGFSSDAPSGSPTEVLINASKQKRKSLAACMKSKGYEYQTGFEYGETDS